MRASLDRSRDTWRKSAQCHTGRIVNTGLTPAPAMSFEIISGFGSPFASKISRKRSGMKIPPVDDHSNSSEEHGLAAMVNLAFVTAYLLTGSAGASEAAVEEAIQSWESCSDGPGLLRQTASAALRRSSRNLGDLSMPAPLSRLMHLPVSIRRCFVLRCLLGLPPNVTGRLLSLSKGDVDRNTSTAMQSLADFA